MSVAKDEKQVRRQLRQLLKVLSRDHAVLLCAKEGFGDYLVRIMPGDKKAERPAPLMIPSRALVKYCLGSDLLECSSHGWVIGPNGRMALRRMLAGAEPFAEQHQQRKTGKRKIAGERVEVLLNDRSSPLGWLATRLDIDGNPLISKIQFSAGERLGQDFQFAGLTPRITSSWSGFEAGAGRQKRGAAGAGIEMSDNRLAARTRVQKALDEVGSGLADILLDICCFQTALMEAEKNHGWPRRSGKVILQLALDRLAKHYGMDKQQGRGDQSSRIDHWGVEDYKPA